MKFFIKRIFTPSTELQLLSNNSFTVNCLQMCTNKVLWSGRAGNVEGLDLTEMETFTCWSRTLSVPPFVNECLCVAGLPQCSVFLPGTGRAFGECCVYTCVLVSACVCYQGQPQLRALLILTKRQKNKAVPQSQGFPAVCVCAPVCVHIVLKTFISCC